MKKIKSKVNHKDNRGIIADLIENEKINAITYITFLKNKVRGNHYHKKTIQWNFVVSGKVIFISKINKIGFSPKISLDEGLLKTINWLDNNEE